MNKLNENIFSSSTINKKGGFNTFSEVINGRFAMMGFVILFLIEAFTKSTLFQLLF